MHGINKAGGVILALALAALVITGLTTPTGSAIGGGGMAIGSGILTGAGTGARAIGPVAGGRAITIGAILALALILFLHVRAGLAAILGLALAAVLYIPTLPDQIRTGTATNNLVTNTRTAGGTATSCDRLTAAENRARAATAGTAANSRQRIAFLQAQNARLRAGC